MVSERKIINCRTCDHDCYHLKTWSTQDGDKEVLKYIGRDLVHPYNVVELTKDDSDMYLIFTASDIYEILYEIFEDPSIYDNKYKDEKDHFYRMLGFAFSRLEDKSWNADSLGEAEKITEKIRCFQRSPEPSNRRFLEIVEDKKTGEICTNKPTVVRKSMPGDVLYHMSKAPTVIPEAPTVIPEAPTVPYKFIVLVACITTVLIVLLMKVL